MRHRSHKHLASSGGSPLTWCAPRVFDFGLDFTVGVVGRGQARVVLLTEWLAPLQDLMISNVVHKAVLEVNEEGAEAAAATAVFLMPLSMPPPPIRVTVNRPFLFFIRNKKTGAVIFTGRMDNPVFI